MKFTYDQIAERLNKVNLAYKYLNDERINLNVYFKISNSQPMYYIVMKNDSVVYEGTDLAKAIVRFNSY